MEYFEEEERPGVEAEEVEDEIDLPGVQADAGRARIESRSRASFDSHAVRRKRPDAIAA